MKTENNDTKSNSKATSGRMQRLVRWVVDFCQCWKRQWRISQANHEYIQKTTLWERIKETAMWARYITNL